jgi:CheY-like chemotaxis protein
MTMRILLIDDIPDSVAVIRDELTKELGCHCVIVGFEQAEESLETHDPHVVILDVLQGTGADAPTTGLETSKYIWEKKFCPLVFYTAHADEVGEEDHTNHPFRCVVKKGDKSEKEVLECIQRFAPQINALEDVGREIRWAMNGVLREIAPRIFERIADQSKRGDALIRSARRRVAAKMDDSLSTGDPNLMAWEFYLCPPVVEHLLTGDLIRKRNGNKQDPASYAVILTPSCDLASSPTRPPKVTEALVSLCKGPDRLLEDLNLKNVSNWKESHTDKLLGLLRQGYSQSCLPLPELPGEFPPMTADFRSLQLIELSRIGANDEEYVRVASVDNPLRELVAWAYMLAAARPGLPDRDFVAWAKEIIPSNTKQAK